MIIWIAVWVLLKLFQSDLIFCRERAWRFVKISVKRQTKPSESSSLIVIKTAKIQVFTRGFSNRVPLWFQWTVLSRPKFCFTRNHNTCNSRLKPRTEGKNCKVYVSRWAKLRPAPIYNCDIKKYITSRCKRKVGR